MKSVPELVHIYNHMEEYDPKICEQICKAAGMEKEWEAADGENFEAVVEKAVDYLYDLWDF